LTYGERFSEKSEEEEGHYIKSSGGGRLLAGPFTGDKRNRRAVKRGKGA